MSSDEVISPEELRRRLYQTFKSKGLLDSLKTQLRNQLVHELRHQTLSGDVLPQPLSSEGLSLLSRASNSLIADHLYRCGYEYTLSVFYPESGLEKEKRRFMYCVHKFLILRRVSPQPNLYKSLTSSIQNDSKKGFLTHLLMELTEHHLNKEGQDASTQTSSTPQYRESIVEKLQLVDEQFAAAYPEVLTSTSLESKLAEYRKQIQEQLQTEMDQKLLHFKEVEIAKIRMEEKEKSRKEITEFRRELEKTFQVKSEALLTREKNAIERLQKQQEIEEKETYLQRQNLLKDIELVRNREVELKQQIESFELTVKMQEEKNKNIEEGLKQREVAMKNIEDTYDQKLKNEILRYQLQLKEEYLKRTEKITEDEKKNKAEALQLKEELIAINSKKEELRRTQTRVKELELELDSQKTQVNWAGRQIELLTEKLQDVSDYPLLKKEKVELLAQTELLKRQLEDTHTKNKYLRERLTQPSAEYLALNAEMRRIEINLKQQLEELDNHKQILEKQLQNEIERCAQLKLQLLESEDSNRRQNEEMDDLKLQLRQTQLALQNEVYRNPKPSLVDFSVIDYTADKVVPHDIYVDGALLRNQVEEPLLATAGVGHVKFIRQTRPCSSSSDSDHEFVADAKARIKELEKEAEHLEQAYRNYQQRIIQAGTEKHLQAKSQSSPAYRKILGRGILPSQHRVTFAEDAVPRQQLLQGIARDQAFSKAELSERGLLDDSVPVIRSISPPSMLFSTPVSKMGIENINRPSSKNDVTDESPHNSHVGHVSPIPRSEYHPSANAAVHKPSSPLPGDGYIFQSITELPGDVTTTDWSLQPSKLHLEDLAVTDSLQITDQDNIPKQLKGDVFHQSEDSVNRGYDTTVLPLLATSQQDSTSVQGELEKQRKEEEEERRWEEERRIREEKRELERLEVLEREHREFLRLENEKNMLEEGKTVQEAIKEPTANESEQSMSEDEHLSAKCDENPLEKYMKIVQQARKVEQVMSPKKESEKELSFLQTLSNEKDESIDVVSHEEADDDFW
ncbi:oral-facial-digital syndrome 1 protein [Protopterus annectens]|uniref:oral-facial-digital syndrome 1 protein n=1 Tax=Protopterus annectens TaxID=7888 RepID=UPI001CFB6152|nr:oral-facial-digital syndrome 1 protein [Protopterus annectens]